MGQTDAAHEQRMQVQLQAIEQRLGTHPGVAAAVAAIRDEQVVAYAQRRPGQALTADELQQHARAGLPAYLVPKHYVVLDALPLDASGSVDRAALPDAATPEAAAVEAPADDLQARVAYLAGVWSALLGREAGPDDNFFDLGGHSMLAVQMANRVKADTGVRLQLMTLASQTLLQIAAELPSAKTQAGKGLGGRLIGNLKGMLRGTAAAGAR
ncbi:MAG TPA: phosphopantetheine-binding protein [Luteimonas sp.]|nr:phosphopantetheine-binding protein [Luteimonas sp.]